MLHVAKLKHALLPLTNMALRGFGLVGRFALSFYLIKFIGVVATGQFGLIIGIAGILPALFGFGLNHYIGRSIIGMDIDAAFSRVRDKIVVMLILLSITLLAATTVNLFFPLTMLGNLYLAAPIIFLEVIAFHLHYALISLRKPLLANFLLFIRSAAWVFPFIGLTYFAPEYRTLDTLLVFWLASLISAFILLRLVTRDWPWSTLTSARIDIPWMKNTARIAVLVYISDLGLVIYSYFDRFFIAGKLGLEATGIYIFFWTLTNALLVLIQAAVVQVSLPALVMAFKNGEADWRSKFRGMLIKSFALSTVMAAVMYGSVSFLLPHLGNPRLMLEPLIFPLMLIAIVVRISADMTHYGLYSREKDKTLSTINILGIAINGGLTILLVNIFGLLGAPLSMLGTAVYLLLSRGYFLYTDSAKRPAALSET